MKSLKLWAVLCSSLCVGLLNQAPAHAQATRTWISGVGDDANPCSRTAPCKTFPGAISKTAAGGEINCLDPGGFGAVTITKAIALVCDFTEGGVLVAGTNGITINAGAGDDIFLSGLDLEGTGSGIAGIRFLAGRSLHVEKTKIRGFSGGSSGTGILFTPSNSAELYVVDTVIADNIGGGILIQPTGAAVVTASFARLRTENNTFGVKADATSTTGGVNATFVDSVVSGNTSAGVTALAPSAVAPVQLMLNNVAAVNNNNGLNANGAGATIRFANSQITGNTNVGLLLQSGATLASYGNNQIDGNASQGATPTAIPQK